MLGTVRAINDADIADAASIFVVTGSDHATVEVYVSTVFPYAAVLDVGERRAARFVEMGEESLAGEIVSVLQQHAILALSFETCRAFSPFRDNALRRNFTYFELLFASEFGGPEDW